MIKLGTLTRIDDLRKIWPDEARDFTPWLAEAANLNILGEAIDIPLELEERESSVGKFSADIYAVDTNTGKKVIIENQLEETNHDHLGNRFILWVWLVMLITPRILTVLNGMWIWEPL